MFIFFTLLINNHPIFLRLDKIIIIFIEVFIMFKDLPRLTHRMMNNINV